jgi:hypothetical protein
MTIRKKQRNYHEESRNWNGYYEIAQEKLNGIKKDFY